MALTRHTLQTVCSFFKRRPRAERLHPCTTTITKNTAQTKSHGSRETHQSGIFSPHPALLCTAPEAAGAAFVRAVLHMFQCPKGCRRQAINVLKRSAGLACQVPHTLFTILAFLIVPIFLISIVLFSLFISATPNPTREGSYIYRTTLPLPKMGVCKLGISTL